MSRKAVRSVRIKKVRRRILFIKILIAVLATAGFLGLVIFGLNTNAFQIQGTVVSGGRDFVNEDIKEYTENILAESYLGLIPKRNIFLYPKWRIKKDILDTFPRIKELSLELDPFQEQILKIQILEREEVATWCRGEDCYFIDKDGYIFAPSPNYSEGIIFSYLGDVENNPVGQQYLDKETFKKISAFIRAIKVNPGLDLNVSSLEKIDEGQYKVLFNENSYILFNDRYGLDKVYENLILAIDNADIDLNSIEYIDIRLSDKVFYKHFEEGEKTE